eukprot:gene636-8139_t
MGFFKSVSTVSSGDFGPLENFPSVTSSTDFDEDHEKDVKNKVQKKRDGLAIFGTKNTVDEFMKELEFFYRLDKVVGTFIAPHQYLTSCFNFSSGLDGKSCRVTLGAFSSEEDFQEVSSMAKAFIILVDKKEDNFENIIKISTKTLLPIQEQGEEFIVYFAVVNSDRYNNDIEELTAHLDFSEMIKLKGCNDVTTIITPMAKNFNNIG